MIDRLFASAFGLAIAGMFAVLAVGCATPPPARPADPPFVSVLVFYDHCTGAFVEAAFVRADGSIVATTDIRQTREWAISHIPEEHGRMVQIYNGECAPPPPERQ